MIKYTLISLVFIFNQVINSTSKNDSIQLDKFKFKNSIQDKIKIDHQSSFFLFISKKSDSINTIYLYKKDTSNIIYDKKLEVALNLDSISKLWSSGLYDSLKITLSNSIEKKFRYNSFSLNENKRFNLDSISKKQTPNVQRKQSIKEEKKYTEVWIYIVFAFGLIFFIVGRKILFLKKEKKVLENDVINLKIKNKKLHFEINSLKEKTKKQKSIYQTNTNDIKSKIIKKITIENKLNNEELKRLTKNQEHRWVTISHSAIGKSHSQANPPIPCQDNSYFESLDEKWQLAIVCDGAGSAKMSHIGSKQISNNILPFNIKRKIKNKEWYNKGKLPSKKEWENIGISVLEETKENLKSWVLRDNKKNATNYVLSDYASTVMIAIYNSEGVLITNIGDGRGGYLNTSGALTPLFIPFGSEESNGTIFITSPIWEKPIKYIQTKVINENILAVFLLSDGMEKITFECSNLTDNVFTDANIPYKKFFYPIFSKIKSLDNEGEEKLKNEWKLFIESGNNAIKNESDDKTLLISFLK